MTITLNLNPETEQGLLAQAAVRGLSLADYVGEVLAREAHLAAAPPRHRTGQDLVDACAQVRGLLTDREVDELFSRNRFPSRSIELE